MGMPWLDSVAAVVGLLAFLVATCDTIITYKEGGKVKFELIPTLLIILLLLVLIYRM